MLTLVTVTNGTVTVQYVILKLLDKIQTVQHHGEMLICYAKKKEQVWSLFMISMKTVSVKLEKA